MDLGLIERGTTLHISRETEQSTAGNTFEAVFRYLDLDDETLFIVQCAGLYKSLDKPDGDARVFIHFTQGANIYSFYGRVKEKRGGSSLVVIEQLTGIGPFSRRADVRDELRFDVQIFGIPEEKIATKEYSRPESEPDMVEKLFDVSAGGFCVITNACLNSQHDPFYLAEFTLGEKNYFLLPARLVRRSNYSRSKIGKFDYGFKFILDNMPGEKGRLTNAALSAKALMRK